MSFLVNVDPLAMTTAAGQLELLGSNTVAANVAAASVTTVIPPPAADDVSQYLSQFFSNHGQEYQAHAARGAVIHQKLVTSLENGAIDYVDVEMRNGHDFDEVDS